MRVAEKGGVWGGQRAGCRDAWAGCMVGWGMVFWCVREWVAWWYVVCGEVVVGCLGGGGGWAGA